MLNAIFGLPEYLMFLLIVLLVLVGFISSKPGREQRRTGEALNESEQRFRAIFDNAAIGIAKVSPDGQFKEINKEYCRIIGYTREEVSSQKLGFQQITFPDDVENCWDLAKQLLDGAIQSGSVEKRYVRKDGAVIWVDLSVCLLRNSKGLPLCFISSVRDITERKQAEEDTKLATLLFQNSSEAMVVTKADGEILNINPSFTKLTGYAADEVIGKNPKILQSGRHDRTFYQKMWQMIETTGRWQGEIWNRRKNGEIYAEWLSINTIFNQDGSVHRRVALFTDISEKKKSEELIWNQANFDFLTQLPNRRMFHDRLELEIKKASRAKLPLALLFIDLDRFKEVNDTLGHDKGDNLLKEAAKRLSASVREVDTVARLGGDEFTVIVGGLHDLSNVERIAQDILKKLAEPFLLAEEFVYVSGSIGITFYPKDGTEIEELLKNADQAMYDAKRQGRNRYSYFTPAMKESFQMQMRLVNDLRTALANHQFRVYYQPIVELATGSVRTAEALVRWQHPTQGLVSPAEFIPIAERSGLIVDIGDWVFREAVSQAARWRISQCAEFRISVNKSSEQFQSQGSNHSAWFAHLANLGLPPQIIVMEITQGLLLEADTALSDQLFEFRNVGMQISIDDFGAGHSMPVFPSQVKVDFIKIDQSLVGGLATDSEDFVICETIISMAHKLGMRVVAEGVETKEQRDLLLKAGCDFGQGYLFSKPVPVEEFEALLCQKDGHSYLKSTDGVG